MSLPACDSTTDPPAYRFNPDNISVPNDGLILTVASYPRPTPGLAVLVALSAVSDTP